MTKLIKMEGKYQSAQLERGGHKFNLWFRKHVEQYMWVIWVYKMVKGEWKLIHTTPCIKYKTRKTEDPGRVLDQMIELRAVKL